MDKQTAGKTSIVTVGLRSLLMVRRQTIGTTQPFRISTPVNPTRLLAIGESTWAFRLGLGLYGVILACGLKQFMVWNQILELEDTQIRDVLATASPHVLRWLVMQPVMIFAHYGYNPHVAFTTICFFMVWGMVELLARAGACVGRKPASALRVWLFLPLATATLLMNGRLIPAFFGLALLLALHLEQATGAKRSLGWLITGQGLGLLLMSVSSGAFVIGAVVCAGSWGAWLWAHGRTIRGAWLPIIIVAGLAVVGVCVGLFFKAAHFFGNDPRLMLNHGAGAWLLPLNGPLLALSCAASVVVASIFVIAVRFPRGAGWQLRLPIAASMVFGLVGWGTMIACLPALVLLGVLAVTDEVAA